MSGRELVLAATALLFCTLWAVELGDSRHALALLNRTMESGQQCQRATQSAMLALLPRGLLIQQDTVQVQQPAAPAP